MRSLRLIISAVAVAIAAFFIAGSAKPSASVADSIVDVSWPNCNRLFPVGSVGIVGITGGKAMSSNTCLQAEATKFTKFGLYVNSGYPGKERAVVVAPSARSCHSEDCIAYQYGYQTGRYANEYSKSSGVKSNQWWIDVETENSWSDNPEINRAAVSGVYAAIQNMAAPKTIGIYSHPRQWQIITGGWQTSWPVWRATGSDTKSKAQELCGSAGFTGGKTWLVQYTLSGLDHNLVCDQHATEIFSAAGLSY